MPDAPLARRSLCRRRSSTCPMKPVRSGWRSGCRRSPNRPGWNGMRRRRSQIAERVRLLAERRADVLADTPGSAAACAELRETLGGPSHCPSAGLEAASPRPFDASAGRNLPLGRRRFLPDATGAGRGDFDRGHPLLPQPLAARREDRPADACHPQAGAGLRGNLGPSGRSLHGGDQAGAAGRSLQLVYSRGSRLCSSPRAMGVAILTPPSRRRMRARRCGCEWSGRPFVCCRRAAWSFSASAPM